MNISDENFLDKENSKQKAEAGRSLLCPRSQRTSRLREAGGRKGEVRSDRGAKPGQEALRYHRRV